MVLTWDELGSLLPSATDPVTRELLYLQSAFPGDFSSSLHLSCFLRRSLQGELGGFLQQQLSPPRLLPVRACQRVKVLGPVSVRDTPGHLSAASPLTPVAPASPDFPLVTSGPRPAGRGSPWVTSLQVLWQGLRPFSLP